MTKYYIHTNGSLHLRSQVDNAVKLGVYKGDFNMLSEISDSDAELILNPIKTKDELLSEEMQLLNNQYDSDMLTLTNKYNIAVARDSSTETEKVLAVRVEINALDAKYDLDQASLIKKYKEA